MIFAGFVFFADRRSTVFRISIGTLHAVTHIVAGFLIYWFSVYVAITMAGMTPKSISQYVLTGMIIIPLSWIAGSIILGFYLLTSLNIFGMHANEAFSALRIQDWKGFLRFRIDRAGTLKMWFIGIKRVPRTWKAEPLNDGGDILRPCEKSDLVTEVIDTLEIR